MSKFILRSDPVNRASVLASMVSFFGELPQGQEWSVEVKKLKKDRSDLQNNALWGVAYPVIEAETGNEAEDMHTYFCGEFFGWTETLIFGRRKVKPRRTTTRDEHGKRDVIPTDKFCEFYAYIQRRCAQIGVYVPDPDPALRGRG